MNLFVYEKNLIKTNLHYKKDLSELGASVGSHGALAAATLGKIYPEFPSCSTNI